MLAEEMMKQSSSFSLPEQGKEIFVQRYAFFITQKAQPVGKAVVYCF